MTQISNIAYVLYNNNQEYEENKNDLKRVDMYETMSNGGVKLTFHDGTTAEFLTSEEYKFYVVPDLSSDETYYQEDDNAILVGIDENYGWSLIKSSNMVYVWGYMLFFLFLMYLGRQAQMPLLGSNAVKWGYIALFILLSFVTIYLLSYNFI
jgi:hypothetical protein